jgi:serine protease AprX
MNETMAHCPFCDQLTPSGALREIRWQTPETIARLASRRGDWRVVDGACPACVQDALLHVLLAQGDQALHRRIQQVWPLDARAAFGALPTPLRLHADPRVAGRGVTVALIDAGFYPHPDLVQPVNRIRAWVDASHDPVTVLSFHPSETPSWPEWRTLHDRQWHGTMTSAVLAGNGWRSHGLYRGLASGANLVLMQVRDDAGHITDEAIQLALCWLVAQGKHFGVRVVNISLGSDGAPAPGSPIDEAVHELVDQGLVVVAAAGNEGVRRLRPPASAPAALTVGGIDDHNSFDHAAMSAWHSNYHVTAMGVHKPELVAPSIWVAAPTLPDDRREQEARAWFAQRQTHPVGSPARAALEKRIAARKLITPYYQHVDGTSFAAPLAASVVACMLEANPQLSPGLVRQILLETAQPVPGVDKERQGAGVVAAGPAVARALSHQHPAFAGFQAVPLVTTDAVTFLLHEHRANQVQVFGDWDGWQRPVCLRREELGVWTARMKRPAPGTYAYKFRLNGQQWLDDPANPDKTWDGFNGFNSLFTVV